MSTISNNKIKNNNLKLYIDFSNNKCINKNLISNVNWQVGTGSITESTSLYGISGYNLNGDTTENVREIGLDPFGYDTILWSAKNNDPASNGDGGWNSSLLPIDKTKMYRLSVWMNREVLGNGAFYFGTYTYNESITPQYLKYKSTGLTNSQSVNPYFTIFNPNVHTPTPPYISGTGSWNLFIAHLWPIGSQTGSNHQNSGVWTINSGKIGDLYGTNGEQMDFIMSDDSHYLTHRTYLYYSTDPTTVQKWCSPRIDLIDGTEPTPQELLKITYPVYDLAKTGVTMSNTIGNTSLTIDGGMKFNESKIITNFTPQSENATYEVWCRMDNYTNNYNMVFGNILPYMSFHSSGKFLLSNRYDSLQCNLFSNTDWETGKIYHVVYTHQFDGTNTNAKIYINGVLDTQTTFTGQYTETTSLYNFTIGDGRETNWYPIDGTVFSIKVYDTALDIKDVINNFETHKSKFGL